MYLDLHIFFAERQLIKLFQSRFMEPLANVFALCLWWHHLSFRVFDAIYRQIKLIIIIFRFTAIFCAYFHCNLSRRSGAWETILYTSWMYWAPGPQSICPWRNQPSSWQISSSFLSEHYANWTRKAVCRLAIDTTDCLHPKPWRENHGIRFVSPCYLSVLRAGHWKAA